MKGEMKRWKKISNGKWDDEWVEGVNWRSEKWDEELKGEIKRDEEIKSEIKDKWDEEVIQRDEMKSEMKGKMNSEMKR